MIDETDPQDDGGEQAGHPALADRSSALADLSDAVRRLVALTVSSAAPADVVASVALEYICLDYMGGVSYDQRVATAGPVATGKAIAKAFAGNPEQLAALMGQLDIEAALNAVGAAAPNLNITVALADDGEAEAA